MRRLRAHFKNSLISFTPSPGSCSKTERPHIVDARRKPFHKHGRYRTDDLSVLLTYPAEVTCARYTVNGQFPHPFRLYHQIGQRIIIQSLNTQCTHAIQISNDRWPYDFAHDGRLKTYATRTGNVLWYVRRCGVRINRRTTRRYRTAISA